MTITRTHSGTAPKTRLPKGTVDAQMHMYLPDFPAIAGGPPLPGGILPGPKEYREFMAWQGIDRVIITQGNAHQADNGNLLACLEVMGDIARGVAVLTPETSQADLAAYQAAGIVGARIMDLPGGAIGLKDLESIDAMTADMGWALAVQFNGSHLREHLPRLQKLRSRWVFDHHGKFFDGVNEHDIKALKSLIDGGKTYFKFAGCYESSTAGAPHYEDVAILARDIAAHAPDRILWGTNWPHNLAKTTEEYPDDTALTDTVLSWLPDDAALQLALVENPEAFFKLPKFA